MAGPTLTERKQAATVHVNHGTINRVIPQLGLYCYFDTCRSLKSTNSKDILVAQAARIFVSHNRHDASWCREFVAEVRTTEADVWYDEHNLGYGRLMPKIEAELRSRPIVIGILSPIAVKSKWVQREINAAINLGDLDDSRLIVF